MADTRVTDLTASGAIADGDLLPIVDISDTAQSAAGSTRKITKANLTTDLAPKASPTFTGTVTLPTGLTGVLRADSGVVAVDSDVTDIVTAASDTAAGKVELATAAETTTGTDTGRAVTPDGLAGSDYGKRVVELIIVEGATSVTTGDKKGNLSFRIPAEMNGYNLVGVAAHCETAGVTGNFDIQINNITQAADMLSTVMRIETGETDTSTSAQPGTIDTANDDVATGDKIRVDVDAVQSGTAPKGLTVTLVFQLP